MTAARELQADGQWTAAAEQFRLAIEIDANYADAHFGLAQVLEGMGDFKSARLHYEQALDLDALRFRADTTINQIIREVAGELSSGLIFVDSESLIQSRERAARAGLECFIGARSLRFLGESTVVRGFCAGRCRCRGSIVQTVASR